MPIFDFFCNSCHTKFEKIVRSAISYPLCPYCDSDKIDKLVSASSFELRGEGAYKKGFSPKKGS